ncbi:MAG: Cys-Gln thioester bond-forming surface protein [Clostridia bacterium]|nr:Cys-Gln thioester bond-forming surface protein [Clostridia bacterium]
MKIKLKIFLLVIPILIFLSQSNSNATSSNGKSFALNNQGYTKKTGYYFVTTKKTVKSVPKIVQTNTQGTVQNNMNKELGIYSVKNGIEFSSKNVSKNNEKYTKSFDLEEYDKINNIYKTGLPKDKVTLNQLSWVLNNICIPENELSKQALLLSAGIDVNTFKNYKIDGFETSDIEKDIIETIQQSAIWHFSNTEEELQPTDEIKIYLSNDLTSAVDINELNQINKDDPINKLYTYLVNGAINAVGNGYSYSKTLNEAPIVFNKESATINAIGNNYIIGPYNISFASSDCSLKVSVNNGKSELDNIKILAEDAKTELIGNNITEKVVSKIGSNFYLSIPTTSSATNINLNVETNYNEKVLTYWTTTANKINATQPLITIRNEPRTNYQSDIKTISKQGFDFALKQYITTINNVTPETSREPNYKQSDLKALANGTTTLDNGTTISKRSQKDGMPVNTGDKVIFTIRIFNEGQVNGIPVTITEYLPDGLEAVSSEESEINRTYNWQKDPNNQTKYTTNYLQNTSINAFDNNQEDNRYKIDYQDLQIECKVTAQTLTTDISLKAVAEITDYLNDDNLSDRDSIANNLIEDQKNNYNPGTSSEGKGYEDDDDYEELIIKGRYFDLALRTYISEVNTSGGNSTEYKREPRPDVSTLLRGDTTATYLATKGPVSVETESSIIYTLRVYNEGQIDGYADEITFYLPEELEYVNDEFNAQFGWIIDTTDTTQRTLKSSALSKEKDDDNKIIAFNLETKELSYKEIKLKCKIKLTSPTLKEITTISEISKSGNNAGLADRDNKSNVSVPSDNELEKYKGNSSNKEELTDSNYYYKGQEDDDDFDKIILENFDLALRYFITDVNGKQVDDRTPQVDKSTYGDNTSERTITTFQYNHDKGELKLCQNDIITFTIRVYNEGTQDGYATQIGNDIPSGFEFLKDYEINKQYNWKMYDAQGNETDDINNAKYVKTEHLAKIDGNDDNLIKTFSSSNENNYKDVKIAFRVSEPTSEDRRITSKAQIVQATDSNGGRVNDGDSGPNDWIEGEDDQDYETIYVKFFDLSLKSIVNEAITIEDGTQKESKTSQTMEQNEKPVVNVSVTEKNIDNIIIKFKISIQVKNEGEIEGYAREISNYIPDGLRFNQADNIKWKETNGKITTDQLANTLLQPGDTATIDLILTWDNEQRNMGVKKNYTEISEIRNNSNTNDIDSIINNKKDGEDDLNTTSFAITSTAGESPKYILIIAGAVVIIGVGAILIKRFVV